MQKVVNIFSWNIILIIGTLWYTKLAIIVWGDLADAGIFWHVYHSDRQALSTARFRRTGLLAKLILVLTWTTTLCLTFTRYSPSSRSEVFNRFLSRWGCDNFDPPGRVRSIAMSVCVCLSSVCLSVCHVHRPNLNSRHTSFFRSELHQIFCACCLWSGSILLWQLCNTLSTSGFMGDVIFAHRSSSTLW